MNMAYSCFVRRGFFDFRTRILPSLKVSELHVFSLLSVNCVPYITFVSSQINFVFNMQKIQSLEKLLKNFKSSEIHSLRGISKLLLGSHLRLSPCSSYQAMTCSSATDRKALRHSPPFCMAALSSVCSVQ